VVAPYTEYTQGALYPDTAYQGQVRLERWADGSLVDKSTVESVFFTTTTAQVGEPAPDPGGSGGDSIIPIAPIPGGTPVPAGNPGGCYWSWELFYIDIATLSWTTTGITGTEDGDITEFSYDLATLDSTKTYRFCFTEVCFTVPGDTSCGAAFVGLSDWDAVCGAIGDSDLAGLSAMADSVYGFPQMCTLGTSPDTRQALVDRVSGVEIGRGSAFLWSYLDTSDNEWKVQAVADGGVTMLAPLAVLETLVVAGQDGTFLVSYEFDGAHVLGIREYPLASISGTGVSFWIKEASTTWSVLVRIVGENGLITLQSQQFALDDALHRFILRFDADGDKELFVDGTLEDTDASGDDYGSFTALPMYVTAAGEFGITAQQAGWDRLLTDQEVGVVSTIVPLVIGFSYAKQYWNAYGGGGTETLPVALPTHADGDLLVMNLLNNYATWTCPAGWTEVVADQCFTKIASSEPATVDVDGAAGTNGRQSIAVWSVRYSDETVYEVGDYVSPDGYDAPGLAGTGLVLLHHTSYGAALMMFDDDYGITPRGSWNNPLTIGTYNYCAGDYAQIGATVGPVHPPSIGPIYAENSGGGDLNYVRHRFIRLVRP
jgi:hypothetical protein